MGGNLQVTCVLYLLKNPGEETRFFMRWHIAKNLVSHLPHPGLLKRYCVPNKKRDKILDLRAQVKILSLLHIGGRGDCFPHRVAHPSLRDQGESENHDLHYDKYSICTFSTMSLGRSRQSLGRFRTVVDGYPWPDLRFGYGVFWDGGRRSGCWAKNRR